MLCYVTVTSLSRCGYFGNVETNEANRTYEFRWMQNVGENEMENCVRPCDAADEKLISLFRFETTSADPSQMWLKFWQNAPVWSEQEKTKNFQFSFEYFLLWINCEMETDIWGQLALEASTVYVTDGSNVKRSPFAETV